MSSQEQEHHIAPDISNSGIQGFLRPEVREHVVVPPSDVPASNEKLIRLPRKRKSPDAPKRFKSSYILFFMAKQPEIKAELGAASNVSAVSRRIAELWRNLPKSERAHWDSMAEKDRARYNIEKSQYKGPWQVPWKRRKKDSAAPKKPMSAFLIFSQYKRAEVKAKHPDLKNTEISRLLGEIWRGLSEEERSPHVEREKIDRAAYKETMQAWREEQAAKEEAQRKAQAKQTAEIQARLLADPYLAGQNPAVLGSYLMQQSVTGKPPVYRIQQQPLPTTGHPVILGPNGLPFYGVYQPVMVAAPPVLTEKPSVAVEPNAAFDDDPNFDFATGDDVDDILNRG